MNRPRVIVPTVYYRDPVDELFSTPFSTSVSPFGYHYRPGALPYHRVRRYQEPGMTYHNLAALLEAMEALDKSQQEHHKCTNCGYEKHTGEQIAEKSSSSAPPADENAPSTSSGSGASEAAKPPEAVSIPMDVDQSDSDSNKFQVALNMKSFKPEDIEITRADNELKVNAKEEVERYGMVYRRELHRSYQLPEDVDVETLKSTLSSGGVLTIEAQRKPAALEDATGQQSVKVVDNVDPGHVGASSEDHAGKK